MRAKYNSFSIVLNGAWNPSIFSQNWLLKYVCAEGTEEISVAFPIDDPTAPRKIDFNGLSLFPGRKQLVLQPVEPTVDGIKNCADIATKILNLLIHTPIMMCGINFAFEEENNLGGIFGALNLSDDNKIDDKRYRLEVTNLSRLFRLTDGNILNLMLSDENSKAQIKFNFHYELGDIEMYRNLLTSTHVEGLFLEAVDFCNNVYGLNLEELTNE